MSVSFLIAKFELKEEFEKFLEGIPLSYIKKMYMQRCITWQKETMEKVMRKKSMELENLKGANKVERGSISESDDFSKLLATQTWF